MEPIKGAKTPRARIKGKGARIQAPQAAKGARAPYKARSQGRDIIKAREAPREAGHGWNREPLYIYSHTWEPGTK